MSYLFDYGEGLFCFVPIFFIFAAVAGALLWNSLPDMTKKRRAGSGDETSEDS